MIIIIIIDLFAQNSRFNYEKKKVKLRRIFYITIILVAFLQQSHFSQPHLLSLLFRNG